MLIGDGGTQCASQNGNLDHRQWIDDCARRAIRAIHLWSFVPIRQKQDGSQIEERWGYYPFMTPNPLPGQELLAKQAAYEAYTEQYLGTPDRVKAQTEVRSNAVHYSYTALDRLTLAGYSIDDSNETFTIVEGPQC